MIKVKLNVLNNNKCPEATQDAHKNLENRQEAIEEYGYGPPDPSKPNDKFWKLYQIESCMFLQCVLFLSYTSQHLFSSQRSL